MIKSNGKKGGPAPRRRGTIRALIPPVIGAEAAERAKLSLAMRCVAFVNGRRFYASDISRVPGNGRAA
jgi:hypothetical protein